MAFKIVYSEDKLAGFNWVLLSPYGKEFYKTKKEAQEALKQWKYLHNK